jgi:DNA-binding GntR family transcriptional regulator
LRSKEEGTASGRGGVTGKGELMISSVTELVYERLRSQILAGSAPGQPLRLVEIADELGVSTTPVRMALERLAAEGLVIQAGRRGASVAPISLSDFQDIYAIRRGLEGTAARLGAIHLTDSDTEKMTELLAQLEAVVDAAEPDVDSYLNLEWQIHELCYRAAGRARLWMEIQAYRRHAERYFRLVLLDKVNLVEDIEHQRRFCAACMERDSAQAEEAAQLLLDWTVDRAGSFIEQAQRRQAG